VFAKANLNTRNKTKKQGRMTYKFRKDMALSFCFRTILYVYVEGWEFCFCGGDHLISHNEELEK